MESKRIDESAAINVPQSTAGFAPGAVGITRSNPDHHAASVIELIAELGFADRDTVANAVEATRQTADTPEGYLLAIGAIDERQLSVALAERSGLDHVDLDRFEVDLGAVAMIGKSAAARNMALPIAFAADGALLVAIDDPYNVGRISAIEAATGSEVRPVIAAGAQIRRLIDQLPEEAPPLASELPPLPRQPAPVRAEPDTPPDQLEPPLAMPPDSVPERNGSGEEVEVEPGALSAALAPVQESIRHFGNLADAVERRLQRSAERERELEERLNEAQEHIAALEESQLKTTMVRELANAASEKLVELQGILEAGDLRPADRG